VPCRALSEPGAEKENKEDYCHRSASVCTQIKKKRNGEEEKGKKPSEEFAFSRDRKWKETGPGAGPDRGGAPANSQV